MAVTLASLDNRVVGDLHAAAEFMQLTDIHDAVVQSLNIRTMQSRNSTVHNLLGVTTEFTPTAMPHDITSLIGKGTPEWLESKMTTVLNTDWWFPVRVISLGDLNNFQQMGMSACAFYGEESNSATAAATQYVTFTSLPTGPCRIRFNRDIQNIALLSGISLPDNLSNLIVKEAEQSMIPRIKFEIAARMRRDEELVKFAPAMMTSLDGIYAQNVLDIRQLDSLWRIWSFRSRSADSNFQKLTPSGKRLYGGGY